jgi:hypothetical protein
VLASASSRLGARAFKASALALFTAGLSGAACETLISDAATRIAYAVRDGAARLRRSSSETLVLSVAWQSWPDGCPAGYRVEWLADADRNTGLGVSCEPGRRSYSTTYYRNFVKVPARLEAVMAKASRRRLRCASRRQTARLQ